MNRWFWFLFFLCLFRVAAPAAAQDREKARQHFEEGEKYYRQGEFEKALQEYKSVLEYVDAIEMYYNIAQCYRLLKNYEQAIFFYRRYLSRMPDSPLRPLAEKHVAALERQLEAERAQKPVGPARVMVVVEPRGAFVWVDRVQGRPAGVTPVMLELSPGPHTFILKKEGYLKRSFSVTVEPGQAATVEGHLEFDPDASILPDPDAMNRARARRPLLGASFWVGAAGTGVTLAGTAIFGMLAMTRNRDWKRSFDDSDRREGMMFGDFATGFAVAAAGFAAFTGWRYFTATRSARKKTAFPVFPFASPNGAGLFLVIPF